MYPVSGALCDDHIMSNIRAGEHGSTFGGNPLAMAIAKRSVEVLIEEKMVENSKEVGDYLISKTRALKSNLIKEVRGKGLFQGIEIKHDLNVDGNDLTKILYQNGLLTKATHRFCVRLTPALVITKKEIDDGMEIIEKSIQELEKINEEKKK